MALGAGGGCRCLGIEGSFVDERLAGAEVEAATSGVCAVGAGGSSSRMTAGGALRLAVEGTAGGEGNSISSARFIRSSVKRMR